MTRCPICEREAAALFELFDDRYGQPGRFRLMRCAACGHRFLRGADFSDAQIAAMYTTYYPRRSLRPEDYRPEAEHSGPAAWLEGARASAFRWVPRQVKVLDIGCGFGQALGYHVNRGCEAWGVESDENVRRVADLHGFNVRIGVFRSDDFPREYFDVVTMDQVIEHMRDPIDALAGVRQVLKPDGVAIVSTPNAAGWGTVVFGRHWINWHAPYHLHFFTAESMRMAAQRCGLAADSLGTVTSSEWLKYQWLHLATLPEPGQASTFWSGGEDHRLRARFGHRVSALLHRTRVNHLLTRLFDALGFGDSQLFRLRRA